MTPEMTQLIREAAEKSIGPKYQGKLLPSVDYESTHAMNDPHWSYILDRIIAEFTPLFEQMEPKHGPGSAEKVIRLSQEVESLIIEVNDLARRIDDQAAREERVLAAMSALEHELDDGNTFDQGVLYAIEKLEAAMDDPQGTEEQ